EASELCIVGGGPAGEGAAGAGAAAPCGIVSLPARQEATNACFVYPEALTAALFAAYSASHWLAVFIVAAGICAGAGAGAAGAGAEQARRPRSSVEPCIAKGIAARSRRSWCRRPWRPATGRRTAS